MQLDNHTLSVGGSAYDVALGPCTVQSLTAGTGVYVVFPDGSTAAYNQNGIGPFLMRTLYALPPHVFPQLLDSRKTSVVVAVMTAIYERIKGTELNAWQLTTAEATDLAFAPTSRPPLAVDAQVPTDVVGQDTYLLAAPAAWGRVALGGQYYAIPLYTPAP